MSSIVHQEFIDPKAATGFPHDAQIVFNECSGAVKGPLFEKRR
jgi:hypothetical protein